MNTSFDIPEFVKITDPGDADALLQLMKRAMMFYAQEAQIPLYRKNGSYTLAALNETRGDVLEAIDTEDFFAVIYRKEFVGSVRLVTDYEEGKSLLTRFCIEPKLYKSNIADYFLASILEYLANGGIREAYLYTAIENKRLMDFYKTHHFQLYSVNNGRPYPRACLIRTL